MSDELPSLDKKVVYLDQLAISEIFKTKTKARRRVTNKEEFWEHVEREAHRAYLLQQVIFPTSSIHWNETVVSPFPKELSLAHELLSGDTSFFSIEEVNVRQVREFAKAYLEKQRAPVVPFDVDQILRGHRNDWLPKLHITVETDFSMFSDRVRANRDAAAARFGSLAQNWICNKPTFAEVLATELRSYGSSNRSALWYAADRAEKAIQSSNSSDFLDWLSHPIMDQFQVLKAYFESSGVDSKNSSAEVFRFWEWNGTEHIPTHRISSYLFAALARKLVAGQKRLPSRGVFNDINAIATYGPYVDAMFVDNECAQILSEQPLSTEVKLKATIFSAKSGDAFLGYLKELQNRASPEVHTLANEIYGLKF